MHCNSLLAKCDYIHFKIMEIIVDISVPLIFCLFEKAIFIILF